MRYKQKSDEKFRRSSFCYFSKEYSNLNEATAYTFHFDVNNVGGATITIKFNNTVEEIELGDYELND